MTAEPLDEATGAGVSDPRSTDESRVVRRAHQMCRQAEPHAEAAPCVAHLQEARRQLTFDPAS